MLDDDDGYTITDCGRITIISIINARRKRSVFEKRETAAPQNSQEKNDRSLSHAIVYIYTVYRRTHARFNGNARRSSEQYK